MYDIIMSRGGNEKTSLEFFNLEANERGIGIAVDNGTLKTTYYILDDHYSDIK